MSHPCFFCGKVFTNHGMSNHQNACEAKKRNIAQLHRDRGYQKALKEIRPSVVVQPVTNNFYTNNSTVNTVISNNRTLIIQNTMKICHQIDRKMDDFLSNAINFLKTAESSIVGQDRRQLIAEELEKYIEKTGDETDKEIMRLIAGKDI